MKWVKFRSTQNRKKAAETEKWEIGEEEKLTSEGDFAGSGGEIWRGMGAISSRVKIVGERRSSPRFKAKREKGTERYRDPRKKQSFSIA